MNILVYVLIIAHSFYKVQINVSFFISKYLDGIIFGEVYMKYFCYTNIKMNNARKELVYMMHPRIKEIIHGLEEIFELKDADIIAFDSILELDPSGNNDVDVIIANYKRLTKKGLALLFDRSPSLDTEVIELYKEQFDLDSLLTLKVNDYLNIRNSMLNIKQYSQKKVISNASKSYGRPKGSKRESPKAISTKKLILEKSNDFNGNQTDAEIMEEAGVSRRSYYLYKNELKKQQNEEK